MKRIDLNCDLGEGGEHDAELMALITSANIACGGHAGDDESMRHTVQLARSHAVAIGAHPGFKDREHFGRRELPVSPDEAFALVAEQIESLRQIAAMHGAKLAHVKPHGALYNQAARDPALADAIARAVVAIDARIALFGPAGSHLIKAGNRHGLKVVSEVFADRNYRSDYTLVPRDDPRALITDGAVAVRHILAMVSEGVIITVEGNRLPVVADTVCVHGETPAAMTILQGLHRSLTQAGIEIARADTGDHP
ncbi:MAG: LamB/YcsF family protein [Cephaloticoccus sp.]|nr:LamB/YcsF family protein [Cephaloticoccus sp.]MCF7761408.1 LamB/YcsF family protein [Cephaloticoccus sp.]